MTDSSGFSRLHRGGSGSPMVCIHGITDTWRTWELVLPALEREHDVLAPTLTGHAGGPSFGGTLDEGVLADGVERAMDEAGFETAHIVGNSLGGLVSLQLAERGRASSVVALAPAGGWAKGDDFQAKAAAFFRMTHRLVKQAAPHADAILSTPRGRRNATQFITTNWEHIPGELLIHQLLGAAACDLEPMLELGARQTWELDAERISCPVRIVWGERDQILPWPAAAVRYREEWMPNADWIVLDDVGHCPHLDVPAETAELITGFAG